MTELSDLFIYGIFWCDSCCLTTLAVQYYNAPDTSDIYNFYNWHSHANNIFILKEQFADALETCNAFKDVLAFGDTQITLDEVNELARLENQKNALEQQIIEEQKADVKEQQNKTIKKIV